MENWTNYLLQANLYLGLFYGFYWLILRRETFFQSNRLYLLSSLLVALLIPLIPLPNLLAETEIGQNLQELNPIPIQVKPADLVQKPIITQQSFNSWDYAPLLNYLIISILALRFIFSLFLIFRLAIRYKMIRKGKMYWVNLTATQPTFSFLNILFWGNAQALSDTEQTQVLKHELVHIRQYHSLDILISETLKILFWYNPIVWFYQKSLRQIHEFLADRATIRQGVDQTEYAHLLVNQSLMKDKLSLGNSFNHHTFLKSRIMKINQSPSAKSARLRFAGIVPLFLVCLLVASCARERITEINPKTEKAQIPAGFTELKTWQVNANSPQSHQYIFSKNTDYQLIIFSNDKNFKASKVKLNLYRMKAENVIDKLVATNEANDMLKFTCDSTALYSIQIEKPISQAFNLLVAFKRDAKYINELRADKKRRAFLQIRLDKSGSLKNTLELGKRYIFILTDMDGKHYDVDNQYLPTFSLIDVEGKKLARNLINDKIYSAMAYAPNKTAEYEIQYEIKKQFENLFLTAYEEAIP